MQKQIEKVLNENCDLKLEVTALKRELVAAKKQQKKVHKHYKKVESEYQTMKQSQNVIMGKLEEKTALLSHLKKQKKNTEEMLKQQQQEAENKQSEEKFVAECQHLTELTSDKTVVSIHANNRNKSWEECTQEANQKLQETINGLSEDDATETGALKKFTMDLLKKYLEQAMTINDLKNSVIELGLSKEQAHIQHHHKIVALNRQLEQHTRAPARSKKVKH